MNLLFEWETQSINEISSGHLLSTIDGPNLEISQHKMVRSESFVQVEDEKLRSLFGVCFAAQ